MFIETDKLIDQTVRDLRMTVKNLRTLSELLAEEVDESTHHPTEISADAQKCQEAQIAIDALIPKLLAAQPTQANARTRPSHQTANNDTM